MTQEIVTPAITEEVAEPSAAQRQLNALLLQGANRFDPVAFRFIESMERRSHQQGVATQRIIETKLLKALEQYKFRYEVARAEAASQITKLAGVAPAMAHKAQLLFENADFKGVRRVFTEIPASSSTSLAALIQQLQRDDEPNTENALAHPTGENTLESLLQQQEEDVLHQYSNGTGPITPIVQGGRQELKSVRLFKNTWSKLSTQKRVNHTIQTAPRDAGPLNSQTLVIRSLAAMQALSPDYLNRFMTYADTLLWLEKALPKPEPVADRNAAGKSSATKTVSSKSSASKSTSSKSTGPKTGTTKSPSRAPRSKAAPRSPRKRK